MLEILEQLGPWVSYPPRLAECLGGVKEAIFLTHILWWKKHSEDGWVFRTREDIDQETVEKIIAHFKKLKRVIPEGIELLRGQND